MIRKLLHWLWTGHLLEQSQLTVCGFCDRDNHVHDANSGRCITTWCDCSRGSHR